jgi:hypothetical protein
MDSVDVNRAIKQIVHPALREHGFDTFAPKRAWQHLPDRTWIVEFRSFNTYQAALMGCTTFSFQVELAIALRGEVANALKRPRSVDGDMRTGLSLYGDWRGQVWRIEEDGSNLASALEEATEALVGPAMAWFERFADLHALLRSLLRDDEVPGLIPGMDFGQTAFAGTLARNSLIRAVAYALGVPDPTRPSAPP